MRPFLLPLLLAAAGCGTSPPAMPVPAARPVIQPEAPATPREQVENPLYRSWAGFPKGTSVVHRSVTEATGNKDVTTTTLTYILIERTDDRVVIQMRAFTRRYDGQETDNPPELLENPRWIRLPPGVNKADFGKPAGTAEQGEEMITVGGKEHRTRRTSGKDRNEAGEVRVTTWTSDEVPGGLVKSLTLTPTIGKKTTLELVEVKRP